MTSKIQIDVWAGKEHQSLVREHFVDQWSDAARIIEQEVEAGMLCNVLHTDFKTQSSEANEAAYAAAHKDRTHDRN